MHALVEEGIGNKVAAPCIMVIFGATGDLTGRKLIPALYHLARDGQLPAHFACVGFARRDKSHDQFRQEMEAAMGSHSRSKTVENTLWNTFQQQIFYHRSEFHNDAGYGALRTFLEELDRQFGTKGNRVFYLSTQPSFFPLIIEKLHANQLLYSTDDPQGRWSRVIIEKPFGHDLTSAQELQRHIEKYLDESQVYRIDHYLGKETVQNLLLFRFSNPIFESLWNNRHIDNIQMTVGEEIGIGTRGNFFEEAGMLRDIVQNHMMQLLSLVAMEPPAQLQARAIHDEKIKVMRSLRPLSSKELENNTARGQYGGGVVNGMNVCGYREENNVSPQSNVETYAALELYIDNARWTGVPFYLRAGKRLPKRATEIIITFKQSPGCLFQANGQPVEPNILVIRIQPNEGISLKINCKVPALSAVQPVKMDFRYDSYFGGTPPEAYERLLCDCMTGDTTLFARADEVLASWKLLTPVLEYWKNSAIQFPNYSAGSWGPALAEQMLARTGRHWCLL
jgi:glucose-6-phosphate 1-dehydrogenase